jgi:hypothetical protein
MSIVNYGTEVDFAAGWLRVEWEFASSGEVSPFPNQDEGQPFDCGGLRIVAVEASGDFGGVNDNGKVDVLLSHEISPENFFPQFTFDRTHTANAMQLDLSHLKQIKPVYNRNNRSVKLAVLLAR